MGMALFQGKYRAEVPDVTTEHKSEQSTEEQEGQRTTEGR